MAYIYLIRTNFREALISRFFTNREIKDSLKLGYAKIKHAKFNTLLQLTFTIDFYQYNIAVASD